MGTVLEARVVRWMCDLAGLGPEAGGTFTSGGTEATFAALLAARAATLPDAWKEGVGAVPPVVLHGEHAHYAVARAVGELGLGTENAVAVPSRGFRMDVAALEDELDRQQASGAAGHGGGRDGGVDRHRLVRRPRGDRPAVRGAGDLAARGRRPRGLRAPLAHAPVPGEGDRAGPLDRVGPAQDDADAALGQRGARPARARPRRRLHPARAVPLPRPRGRAHLGPGGAQLPVLAPAGRDQGVGGPPEVRGGRPRRPLRPPVRHRAGPPRQDRASGATSRRSTSPSRTSSASGSSATGRSTTSGSTPSTCGCGRRTTAPARAGSRRRCSPAGGSCGWPS